MIWKHIIKLIEVSIILKYFWKNKGLQIDKAKISAKIYQQGPQYLLLGNICKEINSFDRASKVNY